MRAITSSILALFFSLLLVSPAFAIGKVDKKWHSERLPVLQKAVSGTPFEVHQIDKGLLIKVHATGTFNPDRPELLLPAALSKVGQMARHLAADEDISIVVLGMSASRSNADKQHEISHARARSLASIFRLNKLTGARMQAFGVGAAPESGPEVAASIVIVPRSDLRVFAAHFREQPLFLAQE